MEAFLLTFIPLFVAIDPIGTIPLFISLTEGFNHKEKNRLALQAVTTALIIGVVFGIAGNYIFSLLGITTADFRIAGGLLLLILSIKEIFGTSARHAEGESTDRLVGVVPLGIPLVAGPAMITTLLIQFDSFNYLIIMISLLANLAITLLLFVYSDVIVKAMGAATSKAVAKVIAIFLAAIGIMMVRKGIVAVLATL